MKHDVWDMGLWIFQLEKSALSERVHHVLMTYAVWKG